MELQALEVQMQALGKQVEPGRFMSLPKSAASELAFSPISNARELDQRNFATEG